jgi:uncharacterized protein YqjF (DUF2071 family)
MIEPITRVAPPLTGRAVASQRWSEAAFLHWRVPSAELVDLLPAGVRPDEFDGSSWVGLIGFRLDRATVLGSPPVPYFGDFAEINVRLYGVDELGRRGVVFLSLEASRLAAVLAARALFSIPYFWSRTSLTRHGDMVEYAAHRHVGAGASRMVVSPTDVAVEDDPLAEFLTARWALFTTRFGRTRYMRNHHEPWPLVRGELVELEDSLVARAGIHSIAGRMPDSVLFSPGVTTWFGAAS